MYSYSNKKDEIIKLLDKFTDPYYLNIGHYSYYDLVEKDNEKALDHLYSAYTYDVNLTRIPILYRLGSLCLDLGKEDDALKYFKIGINNNQYQCFSGLARILIQKGEIIESLKILIESLNTNFNYESLGTLKFLMNNHGNLEMAKMLIYADLIQGFEYLIEKKYSADLIVYICKNKFIRKEVMDCFICFEKKFMPKILCGHIYCINCIQNLKQKKCPYCNNEIIFIK